MKWKTYSINFEMIDNNDKIKINVYLIFAKGKTHAINELLDILNKNGYQLRKINKIEIIKRP